MTESEFMRESQAAVERMREMNSRSKISENSRHKMPPSPSFVKVNSNNTPNPQSHIPSNPQSQKNYTEQKEKPKPPTENQKSGGGFGIPVLDNLLKDGDSALIIGLLLILMSENTDKMLLFALVYILL